MTVSAPLRPATAGWTEPVFGGGAGDSTGATGATARRIRVGGLAITPRWPRSLAAWALIVSVIATVVMVGEPGKIRDTTWNDTYRYITAIERDLGKSDAQARGIALDYYCADLARTTGNSATRAGIRNGCIAQWSARGGLAPNMPRFNLIFDSRPGYPLLAAPFVAGFGLNRGLAVLSVLLTLLAGWGVVLLIRLAGGGTLAALTGMVALYTLPTWFWLNQFLTEAPTLVCTIAVLIGAVLLLRGRTRLGLIVSTTAYVCGFVVRYSTFSVQAGTMLLTIALLAWWDRRWRNRRAGLLAGYSAGVLIVLGLLPTAFGWPGFKASLEDTFTNHYTEPTPPNLYGKWLSLNKHFWLATAKNYLHDPLVPALLLLGAVLLWRYRRDLGAIVSAAALTGLASAAAHPLTSQLDRLYYQVYLVGVCGLPILADLIRRPGADAVPESQGAHDDLAARRGADQRTDRHAPHEPAPDEPAPDGPAPDDPAPDGRRADPDPSGSVVRTT
ncbi:hypothetical protein KGA66_04190 [Actinocrinis puniceicyclus]|uniref:Uncharacterized protein n=1 Tax=Actinocrinis puniceicyclus TaxID=977794 RepID=A0A8J7WLD7_9ACTN|nr:hypothetical protein [Actinocrinis puniceicyclus]MBS2962232.1 hypothetical protein [Actinocrinis puniceicyclus]